MTSQRVITLDLDLNKDGSVPRVTRRAKLKNIVRDNTLDSTIRIESQWSVDQSQRRGTWTVTFTDEDAREGV